MPHSFKTNPDKTPPHPAGTTTSFPKKAFPHAELPRTQDADRARGIGAGCKIVKNAPDHRLCQGLACPLGPRAGAAGLPVLRGVLRNSRVVAAAQLLPLCSAILSGMEKNHLGIYLGKTEGKSSPFQLWLSLVASLQSASHQPASLQKKRGERALTTELTSAPLTKRSDRSRLSTAALSGTTRPNREADGRLRWQR